NLPTTARSQAWQVTLALLKPDVYRFKPLVAFVESKLAAEGIDIVSRAEVRFTRQLAMEFYAEHRNKFFYNRLTNYLLCGDTGVYLLAGELAVQRWRHIIGPTKVYRALIERPDCLRAAIGLSDTRNGFHGSDSVETAAIEAKFFRTKFSLSDEFQINVCSASSTRTV
ncbi:hypothetical protein BOX15_Mlig010698g1, partial [Macrostomum lignano]